MSLLSAMGVHKRNSRDKFLTFNTGDIILGKRAPYRDNEHHYSLEPAATMSLKGLSSNIQSKFALTKDRASCTLSCIFMASALRSQERHPKKKGKENLRKKINREISRQHQHLWTADSTHHRASRASRASRALQICRASCEISQTSERSCQ